jgi:hypothetical protein
VRLLVALGAVVALASGCTPNPAPEAARPAAFDAEVPRVEPVPIVPASAAATASAPRAPASASAAAPTADAGVAIDPSRVKVVTIGMHVGGGPYDEITKEPMKRSVEPHFPELTRCWTHVSSAPRPADMGVDLVIEAAGGRAKVGNPRTGIQGEGFVPCVLAFFESIDFEKPRNGKTVVSYSVRFTPP